MKRRDRSLWMLAMLLFSLTGMIFLPGSVSAGDLEPPLEAVDGSGNPVGTMRTLDEIYDKLEGLESAQPKPFVYVGMSSSSASGLNGFLPLQQACQQDFPNSRICTTEEVINTPNLPSFQPTFSERGFVRSVVVGGPSGYIDSGSSIPLPDASSVNCGGWGSQGGQTKAIVLREFHSSSTDITEFELVNCGVWKVACCAPAP